MFQDSITIFISIIIEATPFVLAGVLVSSLFHIFVPDQVLHKLLPKNKLGRFFTVSLFGFLFPVCECGNVPVARRLIKKGVDPATVTVFLLTAPVTNPLVILATYTAFKGNPEIIYLRVILTILIAFTVGFLVSIYTKKKEEVISQELSHDHSHSCCHSHSKFKNFLSSVSKEFIEMMSILTLGAFLASMVQVILPREAIVTLGSNQITSVIAMMLLAAITSICSNVDSFFALSYTSTFTAGSILSFLVFGPMIDLKALVMFKKIYKTKMIIYIATTVTLLTFLICLFINLNIS